MLGCCMSDSVACSRSHWSLSPWMEQDPTPRDLCADDSFSHSACPPKGAQVVRSRDPRANRWRDPGIQRRTGGGIPGSRAHRLWDPGIQEHRWWDSGILYTEGWMQRASIEMPNWEHTMRSAAMVHKHDAARLEW